MCGSYSKVITFTAGMKNLSTIKRVSQLLLSAIVLFILNMQSVHFLFTEHHAHERCENHIHPKDTHAACEVCKFVVSLLTDEVISKCSLSQIPFSNFESGNYQTPTCDSRITFFSLRAPPSLV